VLGDKQFTVRLGDDDGDFVRRDARRPAIAPEAVE
jgi:hypothetical protein